MLVEFIGIKLTAEKIIFRFIHDQTLLMKVKVRVSQVINDRLELSNNGLELFPLPEGGELVTFDYHVFSYIGLSCI